MDLLFLLKPNFPDRDRDQEDKTYFCPDCAFMEGVLSYYPELRQKLDIRYIDYPRPRKEIAELVGTAHQGCPNLILDAANHGLEATNQFFSFGDKKYTDDPKLIVNYLTARYGIAVAHF
jgi:hypothetical protein